jgi:hypothetical protein
MFLSQRRTVLHRKILSNAPNDFGHRGGWVVKSTTTHPLTVTVCYDDIDVEDDSGRSFTSGVRSKFPSRGGVFRSMNSTVVGSLSPAWRSATWTISGSSTREQHNPTITSQLLANWSSPDLKNDTSCGYPEKKTMNTSDFMGTRPLRAYRAAQYSNVPFPFPIRVSFP